MSSAVNNSLAIHKGMSTASAPDFTYATGGRFQPYAQDTQNSELFPFTLPGTRELT